MSSDGYGSGSRFDESAALALVTLRRLGFRITHVAKPKLRTYQDSHDFVIGWDLDQVVEGETIVFRVLLDRLFPYSPVRIAIVSRDVYLQWPHVETHGLLCLPSRPPPMADIDREVSAALYYATELARRCLTDPAFIEAEFRSEFISYWNRSIPASSKAKPAWSLTSVHNANARTISVWRSDRYTLVADSKEEMENWLGHRGVDGTYKIEKGLYGHLSRPPVPPFPGSIEEFRALLVADCPGLVPLLEAHFEGDDPFIVILAATTESGTGLTATRFGLRNNNGFRPGGGARVWQYKGYNENAKVVRIDSSWVHGRDQNEDIGTLTGAKVAIIGCGSLGSHVAACLAQLGVGSLILVDPEILEPSNVGRHVLGICDAGRFKVDSLAREIKNRFPHMKDVTPVVTRWEELTPEKREAIQGCDLVISCIGEYAPESALNQWQVSIGTGSRAIYGWLDEYGSASHALAILSPTPCFNCVVGPDGKVRDPETVWPDNAPGLRSEPACGALFQPFGPLAVSDAEALVCRLAIDILLGRVNSSTHRIHATATSEVEAAGGRWSDGHRLIRPSGYQGGFDYTKALVRIESCEVCGANA